MKIEFINFNQDPRLEPEVKQVSMSRDKKGKPPSYCLPWVEATKYCVQVKANENYLIRSGPGKIEAFIFREGQEIPFHDIFIDIPPEIDFIPKDSREAETHQIHVSRTPSFSSPWQKKNCHSVTLKLGIAWWTPPKIALFFTSAPHRNEGFRIVEGLVRTDLWHRDIPIVVRPLEKEIFIQKYSVVAAAIPVPVDDLELKSAGEEKARFAEFAYQTTRKRLRSSVYKELVCEGRRKEER
ncbi:MAG: hypothetical protein IT572_01965 [Deltaproteobacteria bacterium]|nr:hypothetical protein [Deltaproteobacteria bacterium]